MAALTNLLCTNFCVKKGKDEELSDFFANLTELDKHIQFIPLTEVKVMTPATVEDELEFFNVKEYALAYIERAQKKKRVNMVKIDSLLDKREEEISDFMEEVLAMKDNIFIADSKTGMVFVTDEAFRDFAKLARLSGDALSTPSYYRDNYIASLLINRCMTFSKKRTPKPAFTAVAFEQCGIKRVLAARSGDYTAIPQAILRDVFLSIMERDDWGRVECRDWYIDHDISYCDIEFPDVAANILAAYPDMPKFPMIPGVRLSTGSTGLNSLKATMTWRYEDYQYPALLDGVTQKHCNTYEGDAFIERVHENIWDKYGELPARLAELYTVSVRKEQVESITESVLKDLALNKVFMQKTDSAPKTASADYRQKIVDYMTIGFSSAEVTLYDIAMRFMTVADNVEMADSYKNNVRNALSKAAYCETFTKFLK